MTHKFHCELASEAMYGSWLYHTPSRTLFDCGGNVCGYLKNYVFGIERVCLSHAHVDHCSAVPQLIGLRAKGRGDKEKPLTIYYPGDNKHINHMIDYVNRLYPKLPFVLTWRPLAAGDFVPMDGKWRIESFRMAHQPNLTTLGYRLIERRTRLKPAFVGKNIEQLLTSGTVKPHDLRDEYTAILLAYCLDNCGFDLSNIENAELAILDSTFIKAEDRDDKSHSTFAEAVEQARAAKVKNVVYAHLSVRYGAPEMIEIARNLAKSIDTPFEICEIGRVLKF